MWKLVMSYDNRTFIKLIQSERHFLSPCMVNQTICYSEGNFVHQNLTFLDPDGPVAENATVVDLHYDNYKYRTRHSSLGNGLNSSAGRALHHIPRGGRQEP